MNNVRYWMGIIMRDKEMDIGKLIEVRLKIKSGMTFDCLFNVRARY